MNVGDKAIIMKQFSEQDIKIFSDISCDRNPIHLDEEYAKTTRFKKRIVHGFLVGSLISAVIATKLPGPGSIYLSQTMDFNAPVFHGDTITAEVTIEEIKRNRIFILGTKCINQNGLIVIEGKAHILFEP